MSKAPPILLVIIAIAIPLAEARAADEAAVMADATRILNQMATDPNSGVPLELLRRSEGVIVVPTMLNASFVVGAKFGRGVFLVRDSKGRWGNPVMIDVAGGSFGLQAGAQATELLMVIRKQETVTRLLAGKGKITLGVDAGVAAGPSGTALGAETDIEMRAEILSYAKSRGLFAGASLGGTRIWVNRSANGAYYENFAATTFQIIEGDSVAIPLEAAKLKGTLTALIDPPPAEDEAEAPVDRKVSRSSRNRRATDDPGAMPGSRSATRRRPADDPDDAPPRVARRKPSAPADPDDAEAPAPRPSSRRPRPADPDDDPADDPPPTVRKRKPVPSSRPSNPDDAPGSSGGD